LNNSLLSDNFFALLYARSVSVQTNSFETIRLAIYQYILEIKYLEISTILIDHFLSKTNQLNYELQSFYGLKKYHQYYQMYLLLVNQVTPFLEHLSKSLIA
jgi:hypothetical protein